MGRSIKFSIMFWVAVLLSMTLFGVYVTHLTWLHAGSISAAAFVAFILMNMAPGKLAQSGSGSESAES